MISRATLALLLVLTSLNTTLWAKDRPSLEGQPGLSEYRAYVGESFAVYGGRGGRRVEYLTLLRIEDLSRSNEPVEQFRLVFLGTAEGSTLRKDSYQAEHLEAGRFRVFLSPGPVKGEIKEFHMDMVLLKEPK